MAKQSSMFGLGGKLLPQKRVEVYKGRAPQHGGRTIVLDNGTTLKLPTGPVTVQPDAVQCGTDALERYRGEPWPPPQPDRLLDKVRSVMSDGRYRAAYEVQREVDIRYGTWASESSIAARIRELRQVGCTVLRRKAPGKRYYQFCLAPSEPGRAA